jgi:hypothetical protein
VLKIAKKKEKNKNNFKIGCQSAQFKNSYKKDHPYTKETPFQEIKLARNRVGDIMKASVLCTAALKTIIDTIIT